MRIRAMDTNDPRWRPALSPAQYTQTYTTTTTAAAAAAGVSAINAQPQYVGGSVEAAAAAAAAMNAQLGVSERGRGGRGRQG